MSLAELVLLMWAAHAVCDYPLQGDYLATRKNRHFERDNTDCQWRMALGMHSIIHAGAVGLITGSALLGWLECWLHWITDWMKCEDWIGFRLDQFIHLACKVAWAAIAVGGVA